MWNANLLRGCCSLVLLALLLAPVGAHAQSGFILTAPGTSRASCTAITSPVTNQTWCADGTGAPSTYLWKVWNGTTYVTVGGGGGGGGGVCGIAGFVTIAGTDTTGTVTFGTAQPDTSYIVTVSTSPDAGMPPGVLAWYRNKTVNGFTVEITAAPGAGNSVDVSWIVSTNNTSACGTGSVTGSGTAGTLPVWATSTSLGDSIVSQTANTLTVSKGSSALQTIQASAAASGAGAELVLHGGVATSGIGGGVGLIGGLPSANTLEGGFIEMFGAVGTPGGHVTARAGNSTSGAGGFVTIAGGSSPGTGGVVSISGGGGTGSGTGGNLVLSAGPGTTAGNVIVNVVGAGTVSGAGSMLVNIAGTNTVSHDTEFAVAGATAIDMGHDNASIGTLTDQYAIGQFNDLTSAANSYAFGDTNVASATDNNMLGRSNTSSAEGYTIVGSNNTVSGGLTGGVYGDSITHSGVNGTKFSFGYLLTNTGGDSFAFGEGGTTSGVNSFFLGAATAGNGIVSGTASGWIGNSFAVSHVTGDRSMLFILPDNAGLSPAVTLSGHNSVLFWLDGGATMLSANNTFQITGATNVVMGGTANLVLGSVAFAALGTPSNGAMIYCTDCDPTATLLACTHVGAQTGAFAYRVNGAWKCMG